MHLIHLFSSLFLYSVFLVCLISSFSFFFSLIEGCCCCVSRVCVPTLVRLSALLLVSSLPFLFHLLSLGCSQVERENLGQSDEIGQHLTVCVMNRSRCWGTSLAVCFTSVPTPPLSRFSPSTSLYTSRVFPTLCLSFFLCVDFIQHTLSQPRDAIRSIVCFSFIFFLSSPSLAQQPSLSSDTCHYLYASSFFCLRSQLAASFHSTCSSFFSVALCLHLFLRTLLAMYAPDLEC